MLKAFIVDSGEGEPRGGEDMVRKTGGPRLGNLWID